MRVVCDDLKGKLADILLEMTALTAEEPWIALPKEHRLNDLPKATRRLFDWALCDTEDESHRVMAIQTAAVHGRLRREHGFGDELVLREYYLLREAVWRVLRVLYPPATTPEVVKVMARLDRAISVTSRAALLGYHSADLEARGQWPAKLHELCAEALLPAADLASLDRASGGSGASGASGNSGRGGPR